MTIDTDKAYLMGLLAGGGIISKEGFQIVLPYKKWGNLDLNPERAGKIAADILARLNPIWRASYKLDISYRIGTDWKIVSNGMTQELLDDLALCGFPNAGELRNSANLGMILPLLKSGEHKKRFIVGLVDTVGSLAASHRRFNETFQVISFEFKGNNFALVCDVVKLFEACGFAPDQVLWNHPNQHSGADRYYSSWKKGFKVRVSLKDYMLEGGFAFESKKLSAEHNAKKADIDSTAKNKVNQISGRVTLHRDEESDWIPKEIRGCHFIHNLHFNAAYGLNIPASFPLSPVIAGFERYFCPFTLLTKGSMGEIDEVIQHEDYLKRTAYKSEIHKISDLLARHSVNPNALLFGKGAEDGFPMSHLLQAAAFTLCAERGEGIRGKRILGSYIDKLGGFSKEQIALSLPDKGTCLMVRTKSYAALVGYINDHFNKTLIVSRTGYKVRLRNPGFKECVMLQ